LSCSQLTAPALAHHGFETEYDRNKAVKLTGVVTMISWTFPHMRGVCRRQDDKGRRHQLEPRDGHAERLQRLGGGRRCLLAGEEVVFEAYGGIVVESRGQLRTITKVGETKPIFSGPAPGSALAEP
jgi:hypothetical protein